MLAKSPLFNLAVHLTSVTHPVGTPHHEVVLPAQGNTKALLWYKQARNFPPQYATLGAFWDEQRWNRLARGATVLVPGWPDERTCQPRQQISLLCKPKETSCSVDHLIVFDYCVVELEDPTQWFMWQSKGSCNKCHVLGFGLFSDFGKSRPKMTVASRLFRI